MMFNDDIQVEWSPEDTALFAACVGFTQQVLAEATARHGRKPEDVVAIVTRGALVGLKGLLLQHGVRTEHTFIPAFNRYVDLLKSEIALAPNQCREIEKNYVFHGQA